MYTYWHLALLRCQCLHAHSDNLQLCQTAGRMVNSVAMLAWHVWLEGREETWWGYLCLYLCSHPGESAENKNIAINQQQFGLHFIHKLILALNRCSCCVLKMSDYFSIFQHFVVSNVSLPNVTAVWHWPNRSTSPNGHFVKYLPPSKYWNVHGIAQVQI